MIHYIYTILNFTMFAQYLLHNNKTLFYIKYPLDKLDKTKIAFENLYPINVKLF